MSEMEIIATVFFSGILVTAILILVKTQMPPVIIQNKIVDNEVRYID